MPTPLDKALHSKNAFFAFAAFVTAATAWSIWGTDMFPAASDPKGDPETWTTEEMRRWLEERKLHSAPTSTWAELLTRINGIKADLRAP